MSSQVISAPWSSVYNCPTPLHCNVKSYHQVGSQAYEICLQRSAQIEDQYTMMSMLASRASATKIIGQGRLDMINQELRKARLAFFSTSKGREAHQSMIDEADAAHDMEAVKSLELEKEIIDRQMLALAVDNDIQDTISEEAQLQLFKTAERNERKIQAAHAERVKNWDKKSSELEKQYPYDPDKKWWENKTVAFDLETTGRDPETARIISASVVEIFGDPDNPSRVVAREWLVSPSEAISDEALTIHGISQDKAHREGLSGSQAVAEINAFLSGELNKGVPLVGYNSSYDLTVLDRESRRLSLEPLDDSNADIVDAFVLFNHANSLREEPTPISSRLTSVAEYYGIDFKNAHSSTADSLTTVKVIRAIMDNEAKYLKDMLLEEMVLRMREEWKPSLYQRRKAANPEWDGSEFLGAKPLS